MHAIYGVRVYNERVYSPDQPYNDLPPIPVGRLETPLTLKLAIAASRSLAALQAAGPLIPNQVVLLRAILLQEARASSEIENVVTTNDALYRAFDFEPEASDAQTREVLRYGDALWQGYHGLKNGRPIRPSLMVQLVQILKGAEIDVRATPGCQIIDDRAEEVVYTPPVGKELILRKLDDLCRFMAQDRSVDPLIAMAAAHRQFEAIHPFPDGNGRTGRVLNILSLIQSELLHVPILYLSWYIVRNKSEYYSLLRAVTEQDDWESWILFMLRAVETTAQMTLQMLQRVHSEICRAAESARAGMQKGYSHELIDVVFSQPYTRIRHVEDVGVAKRNTASVYLRELERLGILKSFKYGRERLFLNSHLLNALTLEPAVDAA